ncbi:MAG: hypothetical protein QXT06_04655 [Candidatus Bathyarchaeia archaeon]
MSKLLESIQQISGEIVSKCIECGLCTVRCIFSSEMTIPIRKIFKAICYGEESILETKDIWICTACFSCNVKCVRGINIPKVIGALRKLRLRKGPVNLIVTCELCQKQFITAPIINFIKRRLADKPVNETILKLCPSCRGRLTAQILAKF